jgi:hypothetical protein
MRAAVTLQDPGNIGNPRTADLLQVELRTAVVAAVSW